MGAGPEPPAWAAQYALLEGALLLYAFLLAVAVGVTLVSRSSFSSSDRQVPVLGFDVAQSAARVRVAYYAVLLRWDAFVARCAAHSVNLPFVLILLRMALSTVVCVLYVYVTYLARIPTGIRVFQALLGLGLLVRLLVKIVFSRNPVPYVVLSPEIIMESLSLSSLILASGDVWLHWSFLQAYIALARYFKAEPEFEKLLVRKTSPFRRQLARLTLEFVAFMYVFACGLQLFEVMGDPTVSLTRTTFELTLANSLYFTVVTIFTVGYGDFVPYTLLGRLWIIFIIVFGAYLVSRKIQQVIDVVVGLRGGLGSFVKDDTVEHCVLCGNIKWEYLKTFVQEFFADDLVRAKKIVVMCERPNWTEELWDSFFASQPEARGNVTYLEGACVSRDDMERAQVDEAAAVFVLNSQHNPEPYMEDSETLKRVLSIRGFAPGTPIYSMCALRDSMVQITEALEQMNYSGDGPGFPQSLGSQSVGDSHLSTLDRSTQHDHLGYGTLDDVDSAWGATRLAGEGGIGFGGDNLQSSPAGVDANRGRLTFSDDFSDDDDDLMDVDFEAWDPESDAICMQEVEMSLLAENVFCNGLSTLLSNLVLNVVPQAKDGDRPWMVEYKIGAECSLAYVQLPREVTQRKFSEIAITLYDYGILLLALKRFSDAKWKSVTPDTLIHPNTVGLVVSFHPKEIIGRVMLCAAVHIASQDRFSENESDDDGSSRSVPSSAGSAFTRGALGSRDIDDRVMSPDTAAQKVSTHGSAAEGARVSDAESAGEAASARSLPALCVPGASGNDHDLDNRQPTADRHDPWSPARTSPEGHADLREHDVVHSAGARGGGENGDELDALADKYVLEQELKPAGSAPSGRTGSPPRTVDGSQRGGATGLAAALEVTPTPAVAGERPARVGRQGSKVSFPPNADTPSSQRPTRRRSFTSSEKGAKDGSSRGRSSFTSRGRSKVRREVPHIIYGDDPLPVHLKGHIVVCVIGQMGLVNLRPFLDRVWLRRRGLKRETPVVAICPKITDEIETDVALFKKNQLFVVHGNSLSLNTLTRAQFDRARAVVVLACEEKNDVDHMDAKALFTIMTLDYRLGERSNTFVCTMIDAEESMQLLRAPTHARRRGVDLGRLGSGLLLYGLTSRVPDQPQASASALEPTSGRVDHAQNVASTSTPAMDLSQVHRQSSDGFLASALGHSLGLGARRESFSHNLGGGIGSMSFGEELGMGYGGTSYGAPFVGNVSNQWSNRSAAVRRLVGQSSDNIAGLGRDGGGESPSFLRTSRTMSMFARGSLERERQTLASAASMGGASSLSFFGLQDAGGIPRSRTDVQRASYGHGANPLMAALAEGGDGGAGRQGHHDSPTGGGGGGALNRNELFEKQRYASGEMMVSSVFVALLIREFAMPGMMSVVRKIFGVGVGKNHASKKCWIRTIKICPLWIQSGADGQRTYRELFELLLELSCVPVGLYRSGDAMVRVQLAAEEEAPDGRRGAGAGAGRGADAFANASADGRAGEAQPLLAGEFRGGDGAAAGPPLSYTCPTTGRFAEFAQVSSGDNVLPYVYTNPEPFTLLSEYDAVYILAHPSLKIPKDWRAWCPARAASD